MVVLVPAAFASPVPPKHLPQLAKTSTCDQGSRLKELDSQKALLEEAVPTTGSGSQPNTDEGAAYVTDLEDDTLMLYRLRCYDPRPGRFLDRDHDPARRPR